MNPTCETREVTSFKGRKGTKGRHRLHDAVLPRMNKPVTTARERRNHDDEDEEDELVDEGCLLLDEDA